jgi:hypothetical protein
MQRPTMAANKINTAFSRILLLAVYGVFFMVQSTAYFDHNTGHTYRLGTDVFNEAKIVKYQPDGFSNGNSPAKKLAIRLNKKFQAQSAILYAMFASKTPVADFIKQPSPVYFDPLDTAAFLLEHSLRGPPVVA